MFSAMIFLMTGLAAANPVVPEILADWPLKESVTNLAETLSLNVYSNGAPVTPSGFGGEDGMELNGQVLFAAPSIPEINGFTICGWINPSEMQPGWSNAAPHTVLRMYESADSANAQFVLRILDGELSGYYTSPARNITLGAPLESNRWNFVAVVCDGDMLAFYLNDLSPQFVTNTCRNDYNRLMIGAMDVNGTRPFIGSIKGLKLYRGPLAEQDIQSIYNQGKAAKIGDWPLTESITNLAGSLSLNVYSNGAAIPPAGFEQEGGFPMFGNVLYAVPSLAESRGLTVCGWINPSEMRPGWSNGAPHTVFRLYDSTNSSAAQLILRVLDGGLQGYHASPAGNITLNSPLATNEWSFVTMVCDGDSLAFYQNDQLIQAVAKSCTNRYNRLMAGAVDASGTRSFLGNMKRLKLYEGALSSNQVFEIYRQEKAVKIGDWPLTGTTTNLAGSLGLSAYYQGSSIDPSGLLEADGMILSGVSLMAVPAVSERRGITVCGWVNPAQMESGWSSTAPHTIFRMYNSTNASNEQIVIRLLDGNLSGYHASPPGNITMTSPLTSNRWNFVAMVCDSESIRFYRDDAPVYTTAKSCRNIYNRLLIGANDAQGYRPLDGKIRGVKFFDGALSDDEVYELYRLEKYPELTISGNLLSSGSFENMTIGELDAIWSFSPTNAWRLDDRQVVDGERTLAVTASTNRSTAAINISVGTQPAGEIVFGGWMSVRNSEAGRYPLVRVTAMAEPAGPPITTFFVPDEPDYYAVSREYRANTQPTYFERRFSVPVSYKSITLSLSVDADVGDFYFDQMFVANATNFAADWNVEKQTNTAASAWRASDADYRVCAEAAASNDDVLWADVDFARLMLAYGERNPLDRGSVQVWAVGGSRIEKLDASVNDDALPTIEDHYQHNGLVRWRARDWAERYEIYFSPMGSHGESSEPEPVALGVGELLRYAPDELVPLWIGWPGSELQVVDADDDGDWDLLTAGSDEGFFICRNIGSNSAPLFTPRSRLLTSDKGPTSPRTSVWLDWDGDGKNDRISGLKVPLGTYVDGAKLRFRFSRNTGSSMAASASVVDEDGTEIELSDATWFRIATGDFDNDGRPDLVVGTAMGTLELLLNKGVDSYGNAVVRHVQVPFNIYGAEPYESGDMALRPAVVDWDGDGHDDIVYTAWQGFVWLLRNQGESGTVAFSPPEQFLQYGGPLVLGDSATPCVVDWDNDGDLDLLSGSVSGHIGYFENIGNRTNPVFAGMIELKNNLGEPIYINAKGETPVQGPAETMWGYLSCEAWDVDGDGDLDLIINDSLGRLRWIENIGTRSVPVLSSQIHNFMYGGAAVRTPWRNRPGVTDLNGDGLLDLFALDSSGYLVLYRQSSGTPSEFVSCVRMTAPDGSQIRINHRTGGPAGRSNIEAGDFDGDGKTDLIISRPRTQIEGNHLYCKNVGSNSSPVFEVGLMTARDDTFIEWIGSAGHEAWHQGSTELVDWDGDGELDLLSGVETGRFTLYKKDYFTGSAFPAVRLLSVEKRSETGSEGISLDGSRGILLQELGVQNVPLQHLKR